MELSAVMGYTCALLIGLSLGMLGGGGSILTIPVLIYLFRLPLLVATSYSLFIVGVTAFLGSIRYLRKGLLDWQTALVFSFPAFIAVILTREFLVPGLPEILFTLGRLQIGGDKIIVVMMASVFVASLILIRKATSEKWRHAIRVALLMVPALIMVFVMRHFVLPHLSDILWDWSGARVTRDGLILGVLIGAMFLAGFSMLRPKTLIEPQEKHLKKTPYFLLLGEGAIVGTLSGFVGAGGGFLILPALVLWAGLPMKQAVGTSLLIVTLNSSVGFLIDLGHQGHDWVFLMTFTCVAVLGMMGGMHWSEKISTQLLKRVFGWFVLVMASMMLGRELFQTWLK